jgi:signal transduction histidine kinase
MLRQFLIIFTAMKQNIRLRLLSYGVIAYMMMAFAWWSVLLFAKNKDAFHAKTELLKIGMAAEGLVTNDLQFSRTEQYQSLVRQYQRQEWMILGEAVVFVISLVIGVWLINRGYYKEMTAAQQRRNFLLSITHELKSPIASIRLVLETVRKRQLKPEQLDKLSNSGLQETERLHALVNDLLLSAKLETAYQPQLELLDLSEIFEEIVEKIREKHSDARVSFRIDPGTPQIQGDRLGLSSLAINLLENAVKYSNGEPQVDVRLGRHNSNIRIEVADQGIGIGDKEKKKIFEKFYRVGSEDTRQTKGTGLGLYIVKQIVIAHRGAISVLDNQPKGTIFRIDLPGIE